VGGRRQAGRGTAGRLESYASLANLLGLHGVDYISSDEIRDALKAVCGDRLLCRLPGGAGVGATRGERRRVRDSPVRRGTCAGCGRGVGRCRRGAAVGAAARHRMVSGAGRDAVEFPRIRATFWCVGEALAKTKDGT